MRVAEHNVSDKKCPLLHTEYILEFLSSMSYYPFILMALVTDSQIIGNVVTVSSDLWSYFSHKLYAECVFALAYTFPH